jgi:cation-transporting ATPase 13A3/4/5
MALALSGFTVSWIAERVLFPKLARFAAYVYHNCQPNNRKQRRQYKVLLEELQT